MPMPYHRTNKGRAERFIRQHAMEWVTVDDVVSATELPRTSIRAAFAELEANKVLQRNGSGRNAKWTYTDWKRRHIETGVLS